MPQNIRTVGILGAGTIGASWTALFLASGYSVQVYDAAETAEQYVRDYISNAWPTLDELQLTTDGSPDRVTFHDTPQHAVEGADFVPESIEDAKKSFAHLNAEPTATETPLRKSATSTPDASAQPASKHVTTAADAPKKSGATAQGAAGMTKADPPTTKGHGSSGVGATSAADTVFTGGTPGPKQKTVAEMLGEVTWLLTQSPLHKSMFLSDLEWFAMTPIILQQFRVFYQDPQKGPDGKPQGNARPIGVLFWAYVNEDVEERLSQGVGKLRPQDWKSGDKLWVVEVVAPFGGAEEMVQDLKAKVFAEKEFKYLQNVDGKPVVRVA